MNWLVCGSVPDRDFPLCLGMWHMKEGVLFPEKMRLLPAGRRPRSVCVRRGTPALLAAVLHACAALGQPAPHALLVGDTGRGDGSSALYDLLAEELKTGAEHLRGITFHYLFPHVDGHNRILMALESRAGTHPRPLLVADAGFMYVAKMSGYADQYDLFTPDAGELAFLADETAPHPFYTRGFLLGDGESTEEKVRRAQIHGNCARNLLIKGSVDCIVTEGAVTDTVSEPHIPHMEPIGGTGDLLTGTVTALLMHGMSMREACVTASRCNRLVGRLADPTPATQIDELLPFLPEALHCAMSMDSSW